MTYVHGCGTPGLYPIHNRAAHVQQKLCVVSRIQQVLGVCRGKYMNKTTACLHAWRGPNQPLQAGTCWVTGTAFSATSLAPGAITPRVMSFAMGFRLLAHLLRTRLHLHACTRMPAWASPSCFPCLHAVMTTACPVQFPLIGWGGCGLSVLQLPDCLGLERTSSRMMDLHVCETLPWRGSRRRPPPQRPPRLPCRGAAQRRASPPWRSGAPGMPPGGASKWHSSGVRLTSFHM